MRREVKWYMRREITSTERMEYDLESKWWVLPHVNRTILSPTQLFSTYRGLGQKVKWDISDVPLPSSSKGNLRHFQARCDIKSLSGSITGSLPLGYGRKEASGGPLWSDTQTPLLSFQHKEPAAVPPKCKDYCGSVWADPWWCVLYLVDVQTRIPLDKTTQGDREGRPKSEPTRGSKNLGNRLHSPLQTLPQTFPRKYLGGGGKAACEQLCIFFSLPKTQREKEISRHICTP